MPVDQVLGMIAFVAAMTGTPGPANTAFMGAGAGFGVRRSLPFLGASLLGFSVAQWLVGAGAIGVLAASAGLWDALRLGCALYILYLAWMIVSAPVSRVTAGADPGFWRGFFVHPLNPKAYVIHIAGITQFVRPEAYWSDLLVFWGLCMVLGGSLNFLWLAGGAVLGAVPMRPVAHRVLNGSLALLLVASTFDSLRKLDELPL
jgi:threonine/homoserine/homoserine lactone efflux protein